MKIISGYTKKKDYCQKIKDFSTHYSLCYYDSNDESWIDIKPIDVSLKYIHLSDDTLIRKDVPKL